MEDSAAVFGVSIAGILDKLRNFIKKKKEFVLH